MENDKEFGICYENINSVKSGKGVMMLNEKVTFDLLNSVYREISEQIGMDTAYELYKMFRGNQVTFPMRFFNPKCIKKRIVNEYNGNNLKYLSLKYSYSEKTIRRYLKDNSKEGGG